MNPSALLRIQRTGSLVLGRHWPESSSASTNPSATPAPALRCYLICHRSNNAPTVAVSPPLIIRRGSYGSCAPLAKYRCRFGPVHVDPRRPRLGRSVYIDPGPLAEPKLESREAEGRAGRLQRWARGRLGCRLIRVQSTWSPSTAPWDATDGALLRLSESSDRCTISTASWRDRACYYRHAASF